jgi:WD40 repeat protein
MDITLSGSQGGTIRFWDSRFLPGLAFFSHTNSVNSMCVSPSGIRLITGSADRSINIWKVNETSIKYMDSLKGHKESVNSVCMSYDGSLIISGSSDKIVKVWDVESKKCLLNLTGHNDSVTSVCVSLDGSTIISGSLDGNIKIWTLR